MLRKLSILALIAPLLTACGPSSPHWENVCVQSHSETRISYATHYHGFGRHHWSYTSPYTYQTTVCDRWIQRCIIDPDYKGPNHC